MKKSDPVIIMTDDGFYFEGASARVLWSAIRRISAHKNDLLTTDEIRLVFEPAFATNSAVLFSRAEQSIQPDRREDAAPG